MIIPTMNSEEIHKCIIHDFRLLKFRYFDLAGKEYDRLRRRNKINKLLPFTRKFTYTLPSKNKWILLLSKAASDRKYKGFGSISILSFTYYYTEKGFRVFKIMPSNDGADVKGISVFNAHLFQRYVERMKLNIENPLEKAVHFFTNNGYIMNDVANNGILGICKDGMVLGNLQNQGNWIVYKTFISDDISGLDQKEISEELTEDLRRRIEENKFSNSFKEIHSHYSDVYYGISKRF